MSTLRSAHLAACALALIGLAACGDTADEPTAAPSSDDPTTSASAPPTEDGDDDASEDPPASDDRPTGWLEVDFGSGTFAVPPDWEIETYEAFGEQRERALYGTGHCPDNDESATGLAFTGWVDGETDPSAAVEAEAERMATSVFADRDPQVELSDLESNDVWVGGVAAVTLSPSDEPCAPTEAVFVIKAAAAEGGSFVFIVVGELGLDASPIPSELVEIANTLSS